ncbi:MAG: hypothetical protein VX265_16590 [Myxococcota bacterium]|nr:hypothetical protein [Myxococcota bacterium]MEC8424516.1 hypothetical protein [Myxococcota bacterium]
MADHPPTADALALQLYQALQQRNPTAAVQLGRPALAAAEGRVRLQGRLHAWLAQAHDQLGAGKPARAHLRAALKLARTLDDPEELAALRPLQEQIVSKVVTANAPAAPPPSTPAARASAAFDAGELSLGEQLARAALAAAQREGDARETVLSWLALARHPDHREEAIREAAAFADASNDRNLVTAVAHAARSAGVHLAPKVF